MVWVAGVSEPIAKSWITVSTMVSEWLGAPPVSCVLMLMLYGPGVASFGTLIVAGSRAREPRPTCVWVRGQAFSLSPGEPRRSARVLYMTHKELRHVREDG